MDISPPKVMPPELDRITRLVPKFNATGWRVTDIPSGLYRDLYWRFREDYTIHDLAVPEGNTGGVVQGTAGAAPALVIAGTGFGDAFFERAHTSPEIIALMEGFAGCRLRPTWWYGPRVYRSGAVLAEHIDRLETHLVNATLNIDCDLAEPWPIFLKTEKGYVSADLQPGQMLLYEGVRFPHSRPHPLKGKHYAGMFLHYEPIEKTQEHEEYLRHVKEMA